MYEANIELYIYSCSQAFALRTTSLGGCKNGEAFSMGHAG